MISNYIKIAWRHLIKNKLYSLINISGLSIGLSVSILILFYVMHEIGYDRFHINGKNIYKVGMTVKYGDQEVHMENMSAGLAPVVQNANKEVLDFVRIVDLGEVVFKNQKKTDHTFKEKTMLFTDSSFFNVFSYALKTGDVPSLFKNPFSVVISEQAAKKYFGYDNPIGKALVCNGKYLFTVSGVMQNVPSNSTMQFDFISDLHTYVRLGEDEKNKWDKAAAFQTYLLIHEHRDIAKIEKSIASTGKVTGAFDTAAVYSLQSYVSQHLGGGYAGNVNARYVYTFSAIGLIILILALFNYMSLMTARSTTRAKEVGVRKVIGSNRGRLILQFYVESFLVCALAFAVAFVLIHLYRPFFNTITGLQIDFTVNSVWKMVCMMLILFIVSAVFVASYPAQLLSRFIPIEVLKGKYTSGQGGAIIRKGITVFQFTASAILIICVILSQMQLRYMKHKDLGFDQSHILALPIDESMSQNFVSIKNELGQLSGVTGITSATTPIFKGYNAWFTQSLKSKKNVFMYSITADENFFKTIDLQWAKAPLNYNGIANKIYINESAQKQLEWDANETDQLVELGNVKYEIGGVLKDFHFTGLKEIIQPLSISIYPESSIDWARQGGSSTIYLTFEANTDMEAIVKNIRSYYEKYSGNKPFEYYFLNEAFNETFKAEARLSTLFSVFMFFAIFIACIGLFGLVSFAAETRTKEIGIRKVLGASVSSIFRLLSKDFLILICISVLIASPIAYYFMNKWLLHFAYRISISWWVFALTAIIALSIAFMTVSMQAIKAALANPIKSLRRE